MNKPEKPRGPSPVQTMNDAAEKLTQRTDNPYINDLLEMADLCRHARTLTAAQQTVFLDVIGKDGERAAALLGKDSETAAAMPGDDGTDDSL